MSQEGNTELLALIEQMIRRIVREEIAAASMAPVAEMLTVAQAAARLAMSPSFVRAAIADGRLPATLVGRAVRVAVADVDALQAKRPRCVRAKPTSAPSDRAATVDIGRRR